MGSIGSNSIHPNYPEEENTVPDIVVSPNWRTPIFVYPHVGYNYPNSSH